jgi:hypothetical protein
MYCGNCGKLLDKSYFVCKSCLIPIDDSGLRTNDAEKILLGLAGFFTLVSNVQRTLNNWEVSRIDRMRTRGRYSFHSANVVVVKSRGKADVEMPLEIDVYSGEINTSEELDALQWEESQTYLAIIAAPKWFMTLAFTSDYSDEYCDFPYKIAKALAADVVYEDGGLEPEFRKVSDLTELLRKYELWDSHPNLAPKSRRAHKAWAKDEYAEGYMNFMRPDGTEGRLELYAQIFTKNDRITVLTPHQCQQMKLIGNGWMLTVVAENKDVEFMGQYSDEVEENLGCEVEDFSLIGWPGSLPN